MKRFALLALTGLVVAGVLFLIPMVIQDQKNIGVVQACASAEGGDDLQECWAHQLADLVLKNDVAGAFQALRYLYEGEIHSAGDCYTLTEMVGATVYASGVDYRTIHLIPESAACNFGFYKEYARLLLLDTEDLAQAGAFCSYVSEKLADSAPHFSTNCYRGIGFALPYMYEGPPDLRATTAFVIRSCEAMESDGVEVLGCVEGGFNRMGYKERENSELVLDAHEALTLCEEQDPKYKAACYGTFKGVPFIPTEDAFDIANTIAETKKQYSGNPELAELLGQLTRSLGYQSVFLGSTHPHYEALLDKCAQLEPRLSQQCIWGLADSLAKNGIPGAEYKEMVALCEMAHKVESLESLTCIDGSTLQFLEEYYGIEKFRDVCKGFKDYGVSCESAVVYVE